MLIQGRAEKTKKDIKQVGKAHSASVLNSWFQDVIQRRNKPQFHNSYTISKEFGNLYILAAIFNIV